MNKYTKKDLFLETLLDLNGEIFLLENGYWTKFDVFEVAPTPQIPHGIKYSLTLHDRNNTRVLGFDNAHALKPKKKGSPYKTVRVNNFNKLDIMSSGST